MNTPTSKLYIKVLDSDMQFGIGLKVLPTKGNLVYEYNPFRNYRLTETAYYYKNKLYKPQELLAEIAVEQEVWASKTTKECIEYISKHGGNSWNKKYFIIPESETDPILMEEGELADFDTNELSFSISNPVNILPQYSYDNSVNLIFNDGKNLPRLVNSRFSATEKNKYQIIDRKGNNDTNIYDQGAQFDIDTSLYKRVEEIPTLKFVGIIESGKLSVGNYHFYFRYSDADGNETDFVAESGLVSIFIGGSPDSIKSGFRNECANKGVQFLIENIDSSYNYVTVYYTKSTSDINQNAVVTTHRINQKFIVTNSSTCLITILGYEDSSQVDNSEINPMYLLASSAAAQEQCQNMLFLGNITKPEIPYNELEDLSLRFLPYITNKDYDLSISTNYDITSTCKGYYDTKFIYNYTGYWNHEYYRFGIVYIMSDNSLSPVFNIRGIGKLKTQKEMDNLYAEFPFYNDDLKTSRKYINYEEDTYILTPEGEEGEEGEERNQSLNLENAKGVVCLDYEVTGNESKQQIFGIGIKTKKQVIDYLYNKLHIKGFFFVRQKRIPTILCQAYTIGIDPQSRTPILPISTNQFVAERILNDDRRLLHDFTSRLYKDFKYNLVRKEGAICPEYDIDTPYYNSIFTGTEFPVYEADFQSPNNYLSNMGDRHYFSIGTSKRENDAPYVTKIIGVEDNVKLVNIGNKLFAARAGEAEEAFRFEYLSEKTEKTEANNIIRGSFGPYLGITGYPYCGKIIDIKIPGFNHLSQSEVFKIRYNDKSPFYAISERIAIKDISNYFSGFLNELDNEDKDVYLENSLYRGDCYICQFTHRLNRNFQDPASPANDKIVDPKCWSDNFEYADGVLKKDKFDSINLGDVNAIQMGMWVTFTVRSTNNLCIRAIDESNTDEQGMFGNYRTFYPYGPMSAEGAYKIPEALCVNKGFSKSVSERVNFEVPDVPAIKNDFTNRIAYSDIHVNDAFKNGYRVFKGTHYRDYPKTYGSITKLIELQGNLVCVFEHGVALIPVNERAVAGEGSGGNIYINTSNVLPENPKIISDTFGSQWRDSVIKTPRGIYGVDTIGKKIWRTNGQDFECISDFKIQEFLNLNISLTERELDPIIGVRNVKTHYNKFKHDVMFTFYDNLHGFEEKVWNVCFNELMQKWITFYSWVPSYSENIYNQYFSFDRNTSKWITKLGISKTDSDFADGVTLSNNIIPNDAKAGDVVGYLSLSNRTIPSGDGVSYDISYSLERDNFRNDKYFRIDKVSKGNSIYDKNEDGTTKWALYLKVDATELCSELYVRGKKTIESGKVDYEKLIEEINDNTKPTWIEHCVKNSEYVVCKDERGRRINLEKKYNYSTLVKLLNIKATILTTIDRTDVPLAEAYTTGITNQQYVESGYYESVIAVSPKYNLQFLTTDFWKHGQAGIIDCADTINPTYWYGRQHPFEFEFVVADNPQLHKIFDNLEIISNNAEPESFHYEIVGDCYSFAKDKKNMYIRQEATKELYQYNGCDILYDTNYIDQNKEVHRPIEGKLDSDGKQVYDKSTIFPLYYSREDTFNEIEDSYKEMTAANKDYESLAGAEIVKYNNLQEYRIWNHAKAADITKVGRMQGNMQYKEDKWDVQINPINIVERNEKEWGTEDSTGGTDLNPNKIPIVLQTNSIPSEVCDKIQREGTDIPKNSEDRAIYSWEVAGFNDSSNSSVKVKDKWVKIRIRYSGEKLAIITAIRTFYSGSYS